MFPGFFEDSNTLKIIFSDNNIEFREEILNCMEISVLYKA